MNQNNDDKDYLNFSNEILLKILKILQKSEQKPQLLDGILDVSSDADTKLVLQKFHNSLVSKLLSISEVTKEIQKKSAKQTPKQTENPSVIHLMEVFLNCIEDTNKLDAVIELKKFCQQSESLKQIQKIPSKDTKYVTENSLDWGLLRNDFSLIGQLKKALMKKEEELKKRVLSEKPPETKHCLSDFNLFLNERNIKFPKRIFHGLSTALLSGKLFSLIILNLDEKVLYCYLEESLSNAELSFQDLDYLHSIESYLNCVFHKDCYEQQEFRLSYRFNRQSVEDFLLGSKEVSRNPWKDFTMKFVTKTELLTVLHDDYVLFTPEFESVRTQLGLSNVFDLSIVGDQQSKLNIYDSLLIRAEKEREYLKNTVKINSVV